MELAIAVLGVMLGAASLTWQYATHVLTGGRAEVVVTLRAMNEQTGSRETIPLGKVSPELLESWQSKGYTNQRLMVEVRSIGRMPITVRQWHLASPYGLTFRPVADQIGPELPHQIALGGPPGEWSMSLDTALKFAGEARQLWAAPPNSNAERSTFGKIAQAIDRRRLRRGVVVIVELGDGRQIASRGGLPA